MSAERSCGQGEAPRVAVVVLSWNNHSRTHACIAALLANSQPSLEVILVDNASTDGSFERLRGEFPAVRAIRNAANLGFSRGCNVGVRAALEDPACRYVLLLNNDCVLGQYALAPALAAAEGSRAYGVVTGKILFDDGSGRIWHSGGRISLLRGQARARGFRQTDRGQFDTPCDTQWASGAMMLIRRDVLETVGALPEEYFFGVEEWDYSLRVRRAGYRIRYVPGFVGLHSGSGSHDNHDPKFAYNYYRNKLLFQERYLGRALFAAWLLAFRLYVAFKMRRHLAHLARTAYARADSPVDEVVFAAHSALRDHGKNSLCEATMLQFEEVLRQWREHHRAGPQGEGRH